MTSYYIAIGSSAFGLTMGLLSRHASFIWANGVLLALLLLIGGIALYTNWQAGCLGAPKDVPLHQGMTLCPGQTAHGFIVLLQHP